MSRRWLILFIWQCTLYYLKAYPWYIIESTFDNRSCHNGEVQFRGSDIKGRKLNTHAPPPRKFPSHSLMRMRILSTCVNYSIYLAWPSLNDHHHVRGTAFEKTFTKMSAQPPSYVPESSFPQVKESYQEVQTQPISAKKLSASSDYTPAPPQLHSENNVSHH